MTDTMFRTSKNRLVERRELQNISICALSLISLTTAPNVLEECLMLAYRDKYSAESMNIFTDALSQRCRS